jgi:hypothetical protein
MLCVWFRGLCFKRHEGRGNQLHLIVLKPHWLFDLSSFQRHQVKTKRLLIIVNNAIDFADDPLASMKGAIIRYAYQAAYGIDVAYPTCSNLLLDCVHRSTELFRHFSPPEVMEAVCFSPFAVLSRFLDNLDRYARSCLMMLLRCSQVGDTTSSHDEMQEGYIAYNTGGRRVVLCLRG